MLKSYYLAKILGKMRLSSFDRCKLDPTARVNPECSLAKTVLGRYSYVGGKSRITDAIIGNFCSIGGKCGIGGGIHPTDMVSTSPVFLKGRNIMGKHFAEIPYAPSKTVIIGNDVWIGEGVCIVSGVKIGDGAVIGAHAVVTKDVAPYSVVAGVPAREIKKRFDEETIRELLRLEWWNWPDEKLKACGEYFDAPERLIRAMKRKYEES